jgi:hypothetical protein
MGIDCAIVGTSPVIPVLRDFQDHRRPGDVVQLHALKIECYETAIVARILDAQPWVRPLIRLGRALAKEAVDDGSTQDPWPFLDNQIRRSHPRTVQHDSTDLFTEGRESTDGADGCRVKGFNSPQLNGQHMKDAIVVEVQACGTDRIERTDCAKHAEVCPSAEYL